jgi:hypothetical protein
VPFGLRNRNPRLLWDLLTRLWQQVDTGVPEQIVTAGSTLVALSYEAGRLQWAEAHEAAAKKNKADAEAAAEAVANPLAPKPSQDESEASPVASSFFKPDLLNPPSIKEQRLMHRHSFQKMNDAAAIRLTTVADRRVPLWEEYVFYRFGNERDCIHRYLVWLPSILLGISERSLWLNVLEQHFHFLMKREKYTVDLSESRLVQIYKLLPETNEIVITHLALAAEERDVLDQAFPED